MKKVIFVMVSIIVACVCYTQARAIDVQRGYVYDTSRDDMPYQWAAIGTEDGYTIIVDRAEYNINNNDSVYVYIKHNHVIDIAVSELNFLNITKDVQEKIVIEELFWNEIPCTVSYAMGKIVLSAPGGDKWYTDTCDWVDVVPDITNTVIVYADKTTGEMLAGIVWGA